LHFISVVEIPATFCSSAPFNGGALILSHPNSLQTPERQLRLCLATSGLDGEFEPVVDFDFITVPRVLGTRLPEEVRGPPVAILGESLQGL